MVILIHRTSGFERFLLARQKRLYGGLQVSVDRYFECLNIKLGNKSHQLNQACIYLSIAKLYNVEWALILRVNLYCVERALILRANLYLVEWALNLRANLYCF